MELADKIDAAFEQVPIPEPGELLAAPFRDWEEPGEMAADFRGKHWKMLSRETLFRRREMIVALSPVGYRGYVAAYLKASLVDGEYASDFREYTLFSLRPIKKDRTDEEAVRDRLSLLNWEQRQVIELFVRRFFDETLEAERVLNYLNSSSFFLRRQNPLYV